MIILTAYMNTTYVNFPKIKSKFLCFYVYISVLARHYYSKPQIFYLNSRKISGRFGSTDSFKNIFKAEGNSVPERDSVFTACKGE